MPHRVPFRVVYSTGCEEYFPAKNLEVLSPFSKGWRSPRFCLYPQELVIQIDPPARIRKLQFLVHHYMIASKVELFVGQLPDRPPLSVEQQAHFSRLGYISLSDNQANAFRSRELKSINLDCQGQLVKLVLHQNHLNRLNLFNQVALLALNVIADAPDQSSSSRGEREGGGDSMQTRPTDEAVSDVVHAYLPSYRRSGEEEEGRGSTTDPVLLGAINKSIHISPLDDLSFAVAQDPETADLIRRLDLKKTEAVREEKFDRAKHLKQVIQELQKIGEVLCRYELEKQRAIEREDYDTAKERKQKVDGIRQQVYSSLGISALLSSDTSPRRPHHHHDNQAHHLTSRQPHQYSNQSHHYGNHHHSNIKSQPRVKQPYQLLTEQVGGAMQADHAPPLLPPIEPRPSDHSPPKAHGFTDSRPLPALTNRSSTGQEHTTSPSPTTSQQPCEGGEGGEGVEEGGGGEEEEEQPHPERLTEKQLNELPVAVEVFGMDAMEHLCAKQYSLREMGLGLVRSWLEEGGRAGGQQQQQQPTRRGGQSSTVRATVQVLRRALRDQVISTFLLAVELLRYVVGGFSEQQQQHRLGRAELTSLVEKVVPILITRTGDMSPRIQSAAKELIMELAQHTQIKSLAVIGPMLVEPLKHKRAPWRLATSRVELLERFYQEVGVSTGGITLRGMMEFLVPCIQHIHAEVRDSSIKLTTQLYQTYGGEVRQYLPVVDDAASRKKTLWKTLFEGFDHVDGIPTAREKEAATKAVEQAKNDEIVRLQTQVQALREGLAAKGSGGGKGGGGKGGGGGGGAGKAVGSSSESPSSQPQQQQQQQQQQQAELDTTCVFCGECRDGFAGPGMEGHYLNDCPMLQSCTHCTQCVEISGLTKHWLAECESRDKFRECPRCKEAVLAGHYSSHVSASSCPPARPQGEEEESLRCPLCHHNIHTGEQAWKDHLMGSSSSACAKNPRTIQQQTKAAVRGSRIPRSIQPPTVVGHRHNGPAIAGRPAAALAVAGGTAAASRQTVAGTAAAQKTTQKTQAK